MPSPHYLYSSRLHSGMSCIRVVADCRAQEVLSYKGTETFIGHANFRQGDEVWGRLISKSPLVVGGKSDMVYFFPAGKARVIP